LVTVPCLAGTTIYCPDTKEPIYEYAYDLFGKLDGRIISASDFVPIGNADILIDGQTICSATCPNSNVPIVGFCYWTWKRGYSFPKFPYAIFTFMVKDSDGQFVWAPYSKEEIDNLMGI